MFTYPFRYIPHPLVRKAASELCRTLSTSDRPELQAASEGKMFGVLITDRGALYSFSGLLGGKSIIEGFVPPIFDLYQPEGHYRTKEKEISAMPGGPLKARASADLQDWIFEQYVVHNALGETASVKEIFAISGIVPPGGTGDCAAPKLLEYAYRNNLKPIAMGEFWYGRPHSTEVREQGRFYPACTGKCGPLLSWMMKGLQVEENPLDKEYASGAEPSVLFADDAVIVADKPSGMLSVPGRTRAGSLMGWLQQRYGEVHSCHRLDMDTAGIMVFARNIEAKTNIELQFAGRTIEKTYRARLCSGHSPFRHASKGTIALPLAPDWYDRPRQLVDLEKGKMAITEYEVLEMLPNGEIEVLFRPKTGRTHQIRVHAAHSSGLGRPIKGDRLYGDAIEDRLWLTAESISFVHPVTGERLVFQRNNYRPI